jgi:hypothetical protein
VTDEASTPVAQGLLDTSVVIAVGLQVHPV